MKRTRPMNTEQPIRFKKQPGTKGIYWFKDQKGLYCLTAPQASQRMAKGQAWYGPVIRYGKTRTEAARKLLLELED